MKTIAKFIYAVCAVVTLTLGTLTADGGALNDLFASVNGTVNNGGGFIYEYNPGGIQSIFASGLSRPRGVTFDGRGNLFVATSSGGGNAFEGSIVKITPDGVQSTFVVISGNFFLEDLALDRSGNVFVMAQDVAPTGVTILKVTSTGLQSTFASLPSTDSFGLAFDSMGFLYVPVNFDDATPSQIWKFAPDGTSSVFATASSPDFDLSGLAFDRFGNLFVSTGNGLGQSLILRYAPDGTESTFASGLNSVRGLAFDRAGLLFLADLLGGNILSFTPGGTMTTFASGIAAPEFLAFPKSPVSPTSTTINFDSIDASANPVGGATLDNYLAQYGVTMSNVTRGSEVVVDDDRRSYGGGVIFASSPHNFLSDYFLNAPNSFTLNFSRPADSVNFTRIAGGPFPTIYASWTATALDAADRVVSSVSEFSPGTANFPARVFTLNGPRIKKVRWDSNGFGIAAFSAVILDDLVLNYPAPGPP